MAQLPHYLLEVDDSGDLGIQETSFVEYPATGLSFLAFEDEKVEHTFAKIDTEGQERLVSGVLMMPNTKYLRQTKEGDFYTVEFKAETLKDVLVKHLKENKAGNFKMEHKGRNLQGFSAVEHWIIEDENTKSPVLGKTLSDLGYNATEIPTGTIMKTTYVADEQFWKENIMSGKVTGYSLGGLFELKSVEDEVQNFNKQLELPTINDVLKLIGVSGENISVITKEGTALKFGQTVSEGDGLANGTYEFNTNLKVVIKDGVIVDYGYETQENNIEMNETAVQPVLTTQETQVVTPTTEVSAPIVETNEPIVVTPTLEVPTAVVPENSIESELKAQMETLSNRVAQMEAQIVEKDTKIAQLESKLDKSDEKNQVLKDKLKEEPISRIAPKTTPSQTIPVAKSNSGRTTLKIGNSTITV